MLIRYNCPRSGYHGAYVLLDTDTRNAKGYFEDGSIRWGMRYISAESERKDVTLGTWVLPFVPLDQRLPEGF
jgi:hypothetical protein